MSWFFFEPLRDPNVIYNFHFYEPHIFTHQGATWGLYSWHWVKGLHYPSSPESAAKIAAGVPDAVDRLAVIRYGQDRWDAARVDAEISQVGEWARQRGVPVVCNEFGAFRDYADSGTVRRGFTMCAPLWNGMAWAGRCGIIRATSEW